jgi:hypothetical protein
MCSNELSKEEKEMMLDIFGKIVTRKELETWIEEWEKDCDDERETQRSFPY